MVVYDVAKHHVRVSDPARGRRRLPRTEFLEAWSGYASVIQRTERFDETPEARTNLRWLLPFVKPHRARIGVAVGMAGLAAALQLALPILTQVVVDDILPNKDVSRLWWLMAAIGAVLVAMTGAAVVQRYLLSWVAVRFDIASLDFVTGRLLELPMSYFNTRRTGDLERRLQGVRQVREFLVDSGVQAITSLTQLAAVVVLMFVYSWMLGLVFMATLPFYALLMRYSATRLRPMYDNLEDAYGRYQSAQIDAIRGMETVKALAAERQFRGVMFEQFRSLAERVFRAQFLVMAYDAGLQLVSLGTLALFLIVGALQVIKGDLSIGEFVAFNTLVVLANAPVLMLLVLWDQLQLARVQLGRLDDVLEHEPEQGKDRSNLRPVTTLSGAIELRNVGFRYGGPESAPILQELTFRVGAGERIAVVGRSGSGKTTLVKLLSGLIEATEGTVLYDGLDMTTLDYRTLRRQVGFVLQESYLFDATIAKNIAFGESEPDMDRVVWAARAANAHEFISRLPFGYETKVGDFRLATQRGPKTTDRDREGSVPPAASAVVRRGDERTRHRVRAGREGEPRRVAGGPHVVRDRTPIEHDQGRAPDSRTGTRPPGRTRHTRGTACPSRALLLLGKSATRAMRAVSSPACGRGNAGWTRASTPYDRSCRLMVASSASSA